ncbi:MAG: Mu transposase domain-containing protein [Acidimicrobiales bacterium]
MVDGAKRWCTEVAGPRSHRSLDGASPLSVFHSVEKEKMLVLPRSAFELASWSKRVVAPDGYVKATGKAIYTVPWRFIGKTIDARESDRRVEPWSRAYSRSTPPTRSARPKAWCAWPTSTAPIASTPPAAGPSRSATRPTRR